MIEKIFNPKKVSIGKDVRLIRYNNEFIFKYFKNSKSYQQTIEFYDKYNFLFVPKLLYKDNNNFMIKQEYVGDLLSLKSNLPKTWEKQLNQIRKIFIENKIFIKDLRFLPYTPLILNNVTVYHDKLYLVDLTMTVEEEIFYINYKFDNLIYQIKLYLFFLKYINYIFLIIPHILYFLVSLLFKW